MTLNALARSSFVRRDFQRSASLHMIRTLVLPFVFCTVAFTKTAPIATAELCSPTTTHTRLHTPTMGQPLRYFVGDCSPLLSSES